jgi:surface polysaccharide O-acyltransferase-like enzyme
MMKSNRKGGWVSLTLLHQMDHSVSAGRLLKYDVIRITAIFFVLLTHASGVLLFMFPDASTEEFRIANIFNGLSRCCIPMLVMLSGALLLDEDRKFDTRLFYRKHLLPILYLLAGWLFFYGAFFTFILPSLKHETVSPGAFWKYVLLLQGTRFPHLWYLYMLIGLYLIIPVLRLFVKRENRNYVIGIILAGFIVQNIGSTADVFTLQSNITVTGFLDNFMLFPVKGYVIYLLLGWLIVNYEPGRSQKIFLYIVGSLSCVVSIVCTQLFFPAIPTIRAYMYSGNGVLQFFTGLGMFVLLSDLCGKRKTESPRIIRISDLSFGVYIVHVAILELFAQVIMPYHRGWNIPAYIAVLTAIATGLPYLIVLGCSKVKYLKKIFYIR